MEVNYQELTTQLWDLLTKEEIERGEIGITCDCGIGMYGHPIYKTRCVIEPNCFYEQALNEKNFIKRLKRLGIIE